MATSVWFIRDLDNITAALIRAEERGKSGLFGHGYVCALNDLRTALGLEAVPGRMIISTLEAFKNVEWKHEQR